MDMETDKLVPKEKLIQEIILLLNSASYRNLEIVKWILEADEESIGIIFRFIRKILNK